MKKFASDNGGATAIEYGMIAGLIAIAIVTLVATIGSTLGSVFYGPLAAAAW
jgi:pilus assembly protein Flp/PilA